MDFLSHLLNLDTVLLLMINQEWSNEILDLILPNITDLHKSKALFSSVVLSLLGFWIWKKGEEAIRYLLLLVIAVALSDSISYRLIKPYFNRPRPVAAGVQVKLRSESHSGPSFPSNHATNVFAAANILGFAVPVLRFPLFAIAGTVAYSRAYVGVHYPLDILAGSILGLLISTLVRIAGGGLVHPKKGLTLFNTKKEEKSFRSRRKRR